VDALVPCLVLDPDLPSVIYAAVRVLLLIVALLVVFLLIAVVDVVLVLARDREAETAEEEGNII
jgi:hypothetical protein